MMSLHHCINDVMNQHEQNLIRMTENLKAQSHNSSANTCRTAGYLGNF